MAKPLSLRTVTERAENFTRDNYVFLGSVIKGFVLAAATLAGVKIFSDPRANWPQAVLLVCSFPAVIVSQVTWARGVLLTNARANIWDTVLPLWMGLMEFTLFGVITPDKQVSSMMWHSWFLILALHSLGAVGLVVNRVKLTDVEADFEEPLRELAKRYMGWMKANLIGASIGTVLSFAFWGAVANRSLRR